MDATTTAGPHRLTVLVGRIRARLADELPAVLWSASDEELTGLLADLEGLSAQVAAVQLAAVREADRRDLGRSSGASSTGSWLAGRLRQRPGVAARTVRLANDLDTELLLTAMALRSGQISADHAAVIAHAIKDLPSEAGPGVAEKAEQLLLSYARVFNPKDLAGLGRKVLEAVDPDLADRVLAKQLAKEEARANRRRELTLNDDPHAFGAWVRGRLDPVTADMFRTALEPLAKPMPTTADGPDLRTSAQRYGDAFAEMLRRYLDSGQSPTQGGDKPHLVINIDYDDLVHGTSTATLLRTGTAISAHTARQFACDATITWHTRGPDGNPTLIDGPRLFVGKTRRLLELRDRGCAFPGCDRPPSWCHGHHIQAWIDGGPTTVANGVLLCGHHHRLIHQGAWQVRMAPDGLPEFIPPEWISATRDPVRHQRLRT
jgi:Domain of unknown function (DUF222)